MSERIPLDHPGLFVEVDQKPTPVSQCGAFLGDDEARQDETVTYVRVISEHAEGQIRGYYRFRDTLRLALPARPRRWDEIDRSVSSALGVPVIAAEGER